MATNRERLTREPRLERLRQARERKPYRGIIACEVPAIVGREIRKTWPNVIIEPGGNQAIGRNAISRTTYEAVPWAGSQF